MTAGGDDEVQISLFCHFCPVKPAMLEVLICKKDCKKDFSSETQLEKHRMSHTGTVPRQYGCNGCDSQFTKLEDMKNHEKIHTKFFTCKQCNIEFTKVSGLKKHKKLHHKQFGCSECDQTFKSKAELEKHEETDDNATKFSCKCGKNCDSSEDLKKHE